MTYQIGDRVYLNEPANLKHGSQGTITNVKKNRYEMKLDSDQWGYWYPESMLSQMLPVSVLTQKDFEFPEISSGLGIGGIGSDDYNITTEHDHLSSHRPHKCGGGQHYDERCAGCGRVTTICNDCELCEHCHGD